MNSIWKHRIAILVSIVMVFAVACLTRMSNGISFTVFATEPTYAEVGTASLSDEGDTVFIRLAKFNVGTEEKPVDRICSGFTVGSLGPEDNPTANVNMDVLTPIWPDAPLSGTLDKDIYICGGEGNADLYVDGLTLSAGRTLTAAAYSGVDVKMGALTVSEIIAPKAFVAIGDKASVTVNGNASVDRLRLYKPSTETPREGYADPAVYNPQYLAGTLRVTGNLTGTALQASEGSAVIVDGDLSGFQGYDAVSISDSSLTVGGEAVIPGGFSLMRSILRVTGDVSASRVTAYQACTVDVSGSLRGDVHVIKSAFGVAGSVNGSEVYFSDLTETATVHGDLSASNLYVSGTGIETSNTALTVDGKVTVSQYIDVNRTATVTAGDVTCCYLWMEVTGPNVLNADSLRSTSDVCLKGKSTLNVTGDCSGGGFVFNIQGDSHLNVGGNLVVANCLDVMADSSASVKGNVTFQNYNGFQFNVFRSGVVTCEGDLTAKGSVNALFGGTIDVTGKLTSEKSTLQALGSGSRITANEIDAAYSVSAIGGSGIYATGTLTASRDGVFAIGKDSVVEAEDINTLYINALGNYLYGASGTSTIIARNDASASQSVHTMDAGTISVGRDLNCGEHFGFTTYYDWNPEDGGWIRVGRDMRYSSLYGCISKGELTVGRDFINSATSTNPSDGLAVYGGALNVGGNVEFGSLLLNTRGDNTPLNVAGRINATRITDIVAKDGDGNPLSLHTVAPFRSAITGEEGVISYTQPWYTQYVMLADENGNSYYADVSGLTQTTFFTVAPCTSIGIACELNGRAVWKYGAPCSVGYSGMSFKLPTDEDMEYADGGYTLTGWSVNADGSGETYAPGHSLTLSEDSTFYACWSYRVFTPEAAAEGTVRANEWAAPGETVALTITPGEGYAISSVSYSYNDGTEDHVVTVDPVNGAYSIVMPEYGITVAASWKKLMTHTDISIQIPSALYTGEVLSPEVTVKDGEETLTENSDYVLALPEGRINEGDYIVTVSAAPNSTKYGGSTTATFTIEPRRTPEITGHSLVLSGSIGVRFYVMLPSEEWMDYDTCRMTFTLPHEAKPQTMSLSDAEKVSIEQNGKTKSFAVFTCYVNAVQMADPIAATLYYDAVAPDGTFSQAEQPVEEAYAVTNYIQGFKEKEGEYNQETRSLVKALGEYGYYAQQYLSELRQWTLGTGEDAAHIAMDDYGYRPKTYSAAEKAAAAQAVAANKVSASLCSKIEKVSYNLFLDSDTKLRVYFKPKSNYSGGASATVDGKSVGVTKSNGRFVVEIPDIAAHKLGKTYTVRLVTGGVTTVVKVSTLSYVQAILSSSKNEKEINAMMALYNYSTAAKAMN